MLPAIAPAMSAARPSNKFHAMVKYSSLCPRRTMVERSKTAACMAIEYDESKRFVVWLSTASPFWIARCRRRQLLRPLHWFTFMLWC
jgi:hypothetical protein